MNADQQFAQTLKRLLEHSSRVLLTMTTAPDGDSLGSLLAMHHIVRHFGQEAFLYSPDRIPAMFEFLTKGQPIMRELSGSVHNFSTVIIFDTGDMKRTPLADELAQRQTGVTTVVNIDHHPTIIEHRGQVIVDHNFVDTSASSNTIIIYRLLQHLGIPLTPYVATALLTGILTDTTHFANINTNQESMEVAADLMRAGADHRTITTSTMRTKSLATLQLWGRALSRLTLNHTTGVVSTVLTLEDFRQSGAPADASTGIANFLNTLSDGKIAMVLQEVQGGTIKASLRTTSDVDVSAFAQQFGGGGHPKAAGFTIRGKLVETKKGWRVEPAHPAIAPKIDGGHL